MGFMFSMCCRLLPKRIITKCDLRNTRLGPWDKVLEPKSGIRPLIRAVWEGKRKKEKRKKEKRKKEKEKKKSQGRKIERKKSLKK